METHRTRLRWSEDEKRAIVAETLLPGASISAIVRRHNLNTNQLQGWRRQFISSNPPVSAPAPAFLAVDIAS